ncbi:MAG: hypothetical protein QGH91_03055 [Candidatus Marinimicrobia bacterium]|jgi:hypothetical protein|nr:hypothetical protein [Candidatus Neomarinimicrobiota bacterium]
MHVSLNQRSDYVKRKEFKEWFNEEHESYTIDEEMHYSDWKQEDDK